MLLIIEIRVYYNILYTYRINLPYCFYNLLLGLLYDLVWLLVCGHTKVYLGSSMYGILSCIWMHYRSLDLQRVRSLI